LMSDAGRAEAAALALCRYYDVLRPESDRGKVTPDECDYGQASEVLAAADAYDREHGWLRIDRNALALVLTGASLDGYMLHDGELPDVLFTRLLAAVGAQGEAQ